MAAEAVVERRLAWLGPSCRAQQRLSFPCGYPRGYLFGAGLGQEATESPQCESDRFGEHPRADSRVILSISRGYS